MPGDGTLSVLDRRQKLNLLVFFSVIAPNIYALLVGVNLLRSGFTKQALLPSPQYGTRLHVLSREYSPAISSQVDSRSIYLPLTDAKLLSIPGVGFSMERLVLYTLDRCTFSLD